MKRAAAVLLVLVAVGGSHSSARSAGEVARVLREAHLDPQRTTITVTLESADGTAPKAPPLQYAINTPSYDEYPRATYSVAGGRAISTSMEPMRSRHRSAQDPAATS